MLSVAKKSFFFPYLAGLKILGSKLFTTGILANAATLPNLSPNFWGVYLIAGNFHWCKIFAVFIFAVYIFAERMRVALTTPLYQLMATPHATCEPNTERRSEEASNLVQNGLVFLLCGGIAIMKVSSLLP